jgi:hypothetical protein
MRVRTSSRGKVRSRPPLVTVGEDFLDLLRADVLTLTQMVPAAVIEPLGDGVRNLRLKVVFLEMRLHAYSFEERTGRIDGFVDALFFAALMNVPDALAVLQQLGMLVLAAGGQGARIGDGQGLGVVQAADRGHFVADHVGRPVLRNALRDEAVQREGGTPAEARACIVVRRIFKTRRRNLDQRLQNRLGDPVLQWRVHGVANPTLDTAKEVIEHPKINMLVATGGRPIVNIVLRSGKKAVGAGAGNPPALVDETAIIRKAAQCIVSGASINNGIFCTCEKEVIVVEEVADSLIKNMQETGRVYLLNPVEVERVTKLVVTPERKINGKYIGKSVQVILHDIGVEVGEECRLAIFDAPKDHPLVWLEQMMPVLPIVRVKDFNEGVELAVKVEQGNRHTAIMHSTHVEHMTTFARAVQTTIFIKNGPSFAGIGLGGEGHTSFTIAGPTGEGLTSARTFTRQRRCTLVESFRII